MSEFIIQGETLAALGDKFRSLTGSSEPMTLVEMINAEVSVGQTPSGSADRITAVINTPYQQGDPVRTVVIDPAVMTYIPNTPGETVCGIEQEDVLSISFPSLTVIDNSDYSGFSNLQQADFPACTEVQNFGISSLEFLNIPACVTIRNGGLRGIGVSSLDLPACTVMEWNALSYCENLTTVNAPLCRTIGQGAFEGCIALTSLSLPACTAVGSNSLHGCVSLSSLSLPACTTVDDYAFYDCNGLTSVSLPACTTVDDYAFMYCSSLEEITLNTACAIAFEAFGGVLDPDTKTLRIYLNGDTVGTCDTSAFGQIQYGGGSSDSGSGSGDETEVRAVPGLEIYVPDALVNDFKTTWANGIFAENIFPMSSVEA